jgi:hypothetical protein
MKGKGATRNSSASASKPPPAPVCVLRGHAAGINALSSVLQGGLPMLASGDSQGVVNLWNLTTKRKTATLQKAANPASGGVLNLHFLSNHYLLTQSRGYGETIKIWDVERLGDQGSPLQSLDVSTITFCKCSVLETNTSNNNNNNIDDDGQPSPEDYNTPKALVALYGEVGESNDNEIALWDLRTSEKSLIRGFALPGNDRFSDDRAGLCMAIKLFEDPSSGIPMTVAATFENGHIYFWDARNPSQPIFSSAAPSTSSSSSSSSSFSSFSSSSSTSEASRLHQEPPLAFDLATASIPSSSSTSSSPSSTSCPPVIGISVGADSYLSIFKLSYSPASSSAEPATSSSSMSSSSLNITSGGGMPQSITDFSIHSKLKVSTGKGLGCVVIRPDKKIFAVGGWDKRVRVYGFKNFKPLAILKQHTEAVHCLCYALSDTKENLLISGSADTRIACWQIY